MRVRWRRRVCACTAVFLVNILLISVLLTWRQQRQNSDEDLKESLANADVRVNWQLPSQPNASAVDAHWQIVAGTPTKMFVYSAFWEAPSTVRMIAAGVTKRRDVPTVWCRVFFDNQRSATVRAQIKVIREHHNMRFGAYFVLCPLQDGVGADVPDSVSLVADLMDSPSNHVRVVRSDDAQQPRHALAVCVKPIHNFNKTLELVEFLEFYRLLGAERFTLYLHSADPTLVCTLRHYEDIGVVELLEWQVALMSQKEVHTENMFAALNDCLYRHRGRSENLALVDFDEFIVPSGNRTLVDLISQLDAEKSNKLAGSYVFQNSFFYRQFPRDFSTVQDADPIAARLQTLTLTQRKAALLPHKQRSKYVCKPLRTLEVGNHFVWEHVSSYRAVNIGAERATSQHYRVCEFGGDDCVKAANLVDRTAQGYQPQLLPRIVDRWRALGHECQLPDVTSIKEDYRL